MKFSVKNKVFITTGNFVPEILKFLVKIFSLLPEISKFPVQNHPNLVIYDNLFTDFEVSGRRNEISGIAPRIKIHAWKL